MPELVSLYSDTHFEYHKNMKSELSFRNAVEEDIPLILSMIKELADYEGLLDEVKADEKTLRFNLFERHMAEVIFPLLEGKEIGFVLFFHNFSTFLGKPGIYIEDLYIRSEYRNRGYGRATIEMIKALARQRECGRVEWWCLDSNTPSIRFYRNIGAEAMSEWTVYRLSGDSLLF